MEITYTLIGDYYLPNPVAPESPKVGRWGMLRFNYLRRHREALYTIMLIFNLLHIRAERKIIRDNFIGIHVKDWRKITLSPGERKLRYIGCPLLQGPVCAEVPVDDIGSYPTHFTPIRVVFLLGTFSGQPQPIHNPLNPLVIHREATPCKFLAYSPHTAPSFIFLEDTLNFRGYICISLLNLIWFSNLIIIGRPRQLHRCQQIFQGISFFTEFLDERCFFALSCAAHFSSLKAISFFMTAFSASRYSILALSRIISSRSDGVSSVGSICFFIWGSLGGRPFRSVANP